MLDLRHLIGALRPNEIKLLKNQYWVKEKSEPDLRGKLLNLIIDKADLTDEQASKILYNDKPGSAYSHLKSRVREDALAVILINDPEKQLGCSILSNRFHCKKLILSAEVLLSREYFEEAFMQIKDAISIARKEKFIPELVIINTLIRDHFPDKFQVLLVKEELVSGLEEEFYKAKLYSIADEEGSSPKKFEEVESIEVVASSQKIKSISSGLKLLHYKDLDYDHALDCASEHFELISENRDADTFDSYLGLAKLAYAGQFYDSAIEFGLFASAKAGDHFTRTHKANLVLFPAFLNLGLYDDAKNLCEQLKLSFFKIGPSVKEQFHFSMQNAWLLYLMESYKESLRLLSLIGSSGKIDSLSFAAVYILEMLNLLQSGRFFQLDFKNENFRKYMKRHELKDEKLEAVYQIFKVFIDSDYEFKESKVQINSYLTKMDCSPQLYEVVDLKGVLEKAFIFRNVSGR